MASLFATLLGAVTEPTPATPPTDDDFWYSNVATGGSTSSGKVISPELSLRVSTVYACVNLLAKTVAALPLSMYEIDVSGNRIAAPRHPLNEILEHQPNRWQSAFDFKAMMMMHLALRGNAYAEIIPGPRGAVHFLEPLHPDLVSVERLQDGTLRYTVSQFDGSVRRLLQSEILHIRSAICPYGLEGISPIAYAKETVGLTLAAEEHGSRMFSNGARPAGVVSLKGRIKETELARFKQKLDSQYSGVGNAHKTLVLEEGATFQPITMRADELQFLQTREFEIEEIARWFDVPLIMLHSQTKQSSWGTGIETIMTAWVRNNLMPWLRAWEMAIRRDLIVAPYRFRAEFDTSALQRGDTSAQAAFYEKMVKTRILKPNEARAALQYNAAEGGDDWYQDNVQAEPPGDGPSRPSSSSEP